jgi:D-sedoheptulose 7-phosphate isomerase
MSLYQKYINDLKKCLDDVIVSRSDNTVIPAEEGLNIWCTMTHDIMATNNTIFFAGNGASAMMASHMAADSSKNGGFRALAFNDPALMIAIGNDISYDQVFAVPLQRFANPGDILVTISSSGNSPNVIAAIKAARELDLKIVTLSGMKENNQSRQMGDVNFYAPAMTYGLAECSHQAILHCWLDVYMEQCEGAACDSK